MPRPPLQARTASQRRDQTSGANRVKIGDRTQISDDARGQRNTFLPYDQHIQVVDQTSKTADISTTKVDVSSDTPPDAVAAICLVQINSNTGTTGNVNAFLHSDSSAAGGSQAIGGVSCPMASNVTHGYAQVICPLSGGAIYYEAAAQGTVNYDLIINIVGWVHQ